MFLSFPDKRAHLKFNDQKVLQMCLTKICVGLSPAVGILYLLIIWNYSIGNKSPEYNCIIHCYICVSCMIRMVNRIKVGPDMFFLIYLGFDNFCADSEARTHADFGETDVMLKQHFITRPSI